MEHYYLTKNEYQDLIKVCTDDEIDMIHAMDSMSGDEFWVFYGSPPEVVLEHLKKRITEDNG